MLSDILYAFTFIISIDSDTIVGDVNGDGEVDISDIVAITNIMAGVK